MSLDDYLDYLLLMMLPLWCLSSFCPHTLKWLVSTSLEMAKSSRLSVFDALCSLSGFLVTQYLFKRFRPSNQFTTTSTSWFTHRTSLSFNILDNAAQVTINLRDLTSRLIIYCRDSIVMFPVEKPTASSMREFAWAVIYATIIRECFPSMLGVFMATNGLQRWMCDLAGLVAFVAFLVPLLVFPSVSHVSNVVNAIHLQEAAEVSLQEERTLIQTPPPNLKKKWVVLVDRLPTPTHNRAPRRPLLPSLRSPPTNSPRNAGDRIRPVIPLTSDPVELSGANLCNTRDRSIEDSFSHLEVFNPVADRAVLTSVNLPASGDRIGSRSSSIAERFDNTLPEVIVEHASEGFSLENDTFSLTDLLSGGPGDNLMENQDMGMILSDISGDDESEFPLFIPVARILDQSSAAVDESGKSLRQKGTFKSLSASSESKEVSTTMVIPEDLSAQSNSVSLTQQLESVPLITVSAVDDSYGANDTFSLTDLLSSSTGKEDNLLNVQEMRDDLANISVSETHDSAGWSPTKAMDAEVCVVEDAEERGAPVASPSSDASINKFVSSPKNRGHKRQRSSEDIIYTSCGSFPMAKMPYELFSLASMRASEVASSLLSNEGRIRCADWRASVDRGQQLLRVEQFAEENDKDLAEFDKMQAVLRSLMREHGLQASATPPRVPSVQIIQASPESGPEKHDLDRPQIIQRPYQFPAFLEKAVPITIDFKASVSSLVPAESMDSMYDPDFPGLDGKQADKYPKLNSDWPSDFPTEADTSDEWKLTQEMIDFWAARKAKMEAENPPPPVNIDDLSMEVDDGGENDRTFADFEDSREYNYEDEPCLPGNSRLKCLGWRYEVVPIVPKPPQEPREHLVETVGNAILNQMYSVYSMYGKQDPDLTEETSRLPSPPPPSPPRSASPIPEPVVETAPDSVSATVKKSAPLRRQSTSKVAPTIRALRPRPSVTAKATAGPERPTARVSDANVLSKPRPRASIATSTAADSRATIKKVVPRQSLPLSAPKVAPRQSLAQSNGAPRLSVPPRQSLAVPKTAPQKVAGKIAQSLAIPKAVPRHSLPQPHDASKVSDVPPRSARQSLVAPKAALSQSLPQPSNASKARQSLFQSSDGSGPPRTIRQSLVAPKVAPKVAPRLSLPQSSVVPKVSVGQPRATRQSLVAPKAAPTQSLPRPSNASKATSRQSLSQSSDASEPPRTTRQSLVAPKVAPRPSLPQSSVVPKVSVAPRTTRQSLTVPKAVLKQSLHIPAPAPKQAIAVPADSIAASTLKPASQTQLKSTTSLPASKPTPTTSFPVSKTQTQPKSPAAVKRVPLAPIQTNISRLSHPSTATTTTTAPTQKSISRLPPPKRMSLAPTPAQAVPGDAPKLSAPRPSLTRLPARRTSLVSRR